MVAGLALLSTLLVAVLTTRAKVTRQWAAAERRLRATEAADALLTAWWQDVKTFPRRASGAVPGDGRMRWRTEVVPNELADRLEATVVRLEVFGDPAGPGAADALAAVEVVLDDGPHRRAQDRDAGTRPGGGQ